MNKEEAKAKLRKAENDLRMANVVLEVHEEGIQEIKEEIAKLEVIINKPDRWQDGLVQPDKEQYFYLSGHTYKCLAVYSCSKIVRKPEHAFRTQEQAELIKEKTLLMWEMYAFAHVRNGGWEPYWENAGQLKYGIVQRDVIGIDWGFYLNAFVFGIVVKSKEIAKEMLEIFGERIEKFYNKQY